jgi:hypothetical protein
MASDHVGRDDSTREGSAPIESADGQNSCTGAESMARFFCSIAFANATGITALHICGRPTYKTRISTKGWL